VNDQFPCVHLARTAEVILQRRCWWRKQRLSNKNCVVTVAPALAQAACSVAEAAKGDGL
jgi:hypothetical protein